MAGFRFSSLGASVALAALALAGCNRTPSANQLLLDNQSAAAPLPTLPATLPMTDVAAPPPVAAPAATALPETRPIRTVRVRDPRRGAEYAYADAAYQFSDALGEAPPDYGFDYAGVQPWAWEGYDDSLVFAEPVPGGYRTYYYEPGEEEPYFVRDPYYSYGYDNGQLAVVYDVSGDIVPWEDYGPQVVYASRYLMRGQDLWRASRGDRVSINVQNWTNYRTNYFNQQQRWDATRVRQPMWMNYAQQDVAAQRHWQAEQARRSIDQQRFNSWQAQGFRAAPPPRAIPAQWQQASWARDPHRFTPVAATVAGGAAIAAGAMLAHNAQVRHQQQQQLLQAQQVNATRLQHEQMAQQQQQRAFTAREQAQARNFQAGQQRELQQQAALARQQQAQAARVQQNERVAAQRQQAQATAQREQQAMRAQRDQQVRSERATMQREQPVPSATSRCARNGSRCSANSNRCASNAATPSASNRPRAPSSNRRASRRWRSAVSRPRPVARNRCRRARCNAPNRAPRRAPSRNARRHTAGRTSTAAAEETRPSGWRDAGIGCTAPASPIP